MKKLLFISAFLMAFGFSATAQYSCVMGACVENVFGGEYETLEDCEAECGVEETPWACALGSCYEDVTGMLGSYATEEECLAECSADSASYLGQWYLEEDNEYMVIGVDTLLVISEGVKDCYEFMYIPYVDSLGSLFVTVEGMTLPVGYEVDGDSLFLNMMGDEYAYATNAADLSEFVDCADSYSWACDVDGCYDAGVGNGEFGSLEDCEWECYTGEMTYECWGGSCFEANDEGSYDSMEECQELCEVEEVTWACLASGCYESEFGLGSYATEEECLEACSSENQTWECLGGACYEAGSFGSYATQEECESVCEEVEALWVCAAGSCYEDATGLVGSYTTQEECEAACTETEVEENATTITLAPNPFSDYTILEFTNNPMHYKVFDMSGRLVRTEKITTNRMQFSRGDLPSGIYYLEVIGDEAVIREKLLVE